MKYFIFVQRKTPTSVSGGMKTILFPVQRKSELPLNKDKSLRRTRGTSADNATGGGVLSAGGC